VARFSELGESRLDMLVNVAGKSRVSFSRCLEGDRRAKGGRDERDKKLGKEIDSVGRKYGTEMRREGLLWNSQGC
jgi:hypothetical protein